MFSFKPLFFFALLAASSAVALRSSPRQLSQEQIAGFAPQTSVTDHNAIDLDQQAMEVQLAELTSSGFANAKRIYQEGGHSKTYAVLNLGSALTSAVSKGEEVTGGVDTTGQPVVGKAFADTSVGSNTLQVQYSTSTVQATWSDCIVGGLQETITDGCYAASGSIMVGGSSYDYTYAIETGNKNGRTLQGFSTGADKSMRENGDGPYYSTFQKFYDYYGRHDYGDAFVLAAFDGSAVSMNGKTFDFSSYGFTGKAEAVKKGSAYMNTAMYVIRELEDALDDCAASFSKRNDDAVHALDEAVAFYTGTLEGKEGSGDGVQMYALAEKRCENFKTCGENRDSTEGVARVNIDIFRQFDIMQRRLNTGDCQKARNNKYEIETQMLIPLVQGTLRYAWKQEYEQERGEKEEAEGATFAAAILPVVARCSEKDAGIIFDNMKPGSGFKADYSAVKGAFERNYACMGITCGDVGGQYDDATGAWLIGAAPCSSSSSVNVGLAVGLSIGGIVALALVCLFIKRRRSGDVEFKSNDQPTV